METRYPLLCDKGPQSPAAKITYLTQFLRQELGSLLAGRGVPFWAGISQEVAVETPAEPADLGTSGICC